MVVEVLIFAPSLILSYSHPNHESEIISFFTHESKTVINFSVKAMAITFGGPDLNLLEQMGDNSTFGINQPLSGFLVPSWIFAISGLTLIRMEVAPEVIMEDEPLGESSEVEDESESGFMGMLRGEMVKLTLRKSENDLASSRRELERNLLR